MKSKTYLFLASVLLCSVVLSFLVIVVRARDEHPIQSFGVIQTSSVGQSLKLGTYGASTSYFYDLTADQIASTYNMSQSLYAGADALTDPYVVKMARVKTLNPAYKALTYRNVLCFYKSWTDEWNIAMNNGWLLKDASGNYIVTAGGENYMADTTNQNYHQWLANMLKSHLDWHPTIWDGVMLDCCLVTSAYEWEAVGGGQAIKPGTNRRFTDAEVLTGYSQLINAVIAKLGPSKLVLPNGIWNGNMFYNNPGYNTILSNVPQLNALGSESTFFEMNGVRYYSETEWKYSIDMIVWVQDNFLSGHSDRRFSTFCNVVDSSLPSGATQEQMMLFGYCSVMLAIKNDQNSIGFGFDLGNSPTVLTLAQTLRNVDIGESLGNYYKIVGTSVYARDFSRGKVLVNPTDTSYTVGLDKSYVTYDGNAVSDSLTLISHSGVILLNS